MRWMVTGLDEAGRSCIVSSGEQCLGEGETPHIERIVATELSPPPPTAGGAAPLRDLGVGVGLLHWRVLSWGPDFEIPVHHTDTIDLDCVIEGNVELILDDGPHSLGPGDCVVLSGVDHGWRTTGAGCVITVALFGTLPTSSVG